MEENKRFMRLGLFVVITLSALTAALLLLGGWKWFQPTFTFETYFDKSVAGLDIGAPVLFRGVPLGHVSEILTSAATYERAVPLDQRREYIVVRVAVNLSAREATQMNQDAPTLIKKGLRAQTQLQGISGQQYLALDFLDPKKYPALEFPWKPEYTYLPSAPSSVGEIIAKAQTFLANLSEADIKTLGKNLNTLVSDLDKKVDELPVAELSTGAHDVLKSAHATLERLDGILAAAPIDHTLRKFDSVSGRLDDLLADPSLKHTAENVAAISARLRKLTDDGDLDRITKGIDESTERLEIMLGDNQYDVRAIVQDLRATTVNLRELSETIKRYPAGVLVGGPPAKIKLPETHHVP
jgi:ABC-type transporter Mla subunit MlaD